MTTPFSDVYDQFLVLCQDYKLTELYQSSTQNFETFLSGWLLPAITDFKNPNQSIAYTGTTFTETLTRENIKILALIMKKYWLKHEIDDVTQINLHIRDRDFNTYAEANNLKEKMSAYQSDLEEVSQTLVDYGLENVDWSSWLDGTFFVP